MLSPVVSTLMRGWPPALVLSVPKGLGRTKPG